jgi:nudix-type nucleoside diphosphatase (YffH/AdpP family)
MYKVNKEKIILNSSLVVQEGKITMDDGKEFTRLCLKRQDAAVVLIVNKETNKVVLTRQFRYPVSTKATKQIFEIVAGKVDENEEPQETAIRESEEETGYRIKRGNIRPLLSCFSSPGYTSERFFVYYAIVTNADKVSKGGGLKSENEFIEVVEMDTKEFIKLLQNKEIEDAKTYIAGMCMLLEEHTFHNQ